MPGRPVREGGRLADVTIGTWLDTTKTLQAIAPYSVSGRTARAAAWSEQLSTAAVSSRFFEMLSIRPVAGRLFTATDDLRESPPVALISQRLWIQALGARPETVGSIINIEDAPYTIIGVVPDSLTFPEPGIDVWTPGRWRWPAAGARRSFAMQIDVIALMRPGATLEDVRREGEHVLTTIVAAESTTGTGVQVPRLHAALLLDDMVGPARPALVALLAGMALVLVAACVNLANLLLARNTSRMRELAIRLTLGASRARIVAPIVIEQVALVFVGAALGALLAWWTLRALPALAPPELPRLTDVGFSLPALLLAAAAAFVTCLAASLLPAWTLPQSSLRDLSVPNRAAMTGRPMSAESVRSALVVVQVALAVVLLVGATLIGRSLIALLQLHPGYDADGVVTFQVGLRYDAFRQSDRGVVFFRELLDRVAGVPGVVSVGTSSALPLHTGGFWGQVRVAGEPPATAPDERPRARTTIVSHTYLPTMRTRLLRGRGFEAGDQRSSQPVVLIDQALADAYFSGRDPLGRQVIGFGGRPWTIVGIVESVQLVGMSVAPIPVLYYPLTQVSEFLGLSGFGAGVAVRTTGDPAALLPLVRDFAREMDASAPVFNAMPLRDRIGATLTQPRFYTIVLGLFAGLSLSTAVLGVFGVLAYATERRRVEFGVRRALGAAERQVAGLVLRRSVSLAAAGLALGLASAAAGAGLLESLLFGIEPLDAVSYAIVSAGVLVTVLLASWHPTRTALRVDPAEALRSE